MKNNNHRLITISKSFWTDLADDEIEKQYETKDWRVDGSIKKFPELCQFFWEAQYVENGEDCFRVYKDGYCASLEEAKERIERLTGISVDKALGQSILLKSLKEEVERLKNILPPEKERSRGVVGEGSWAVFAEKMMAERDEAREELRLLKAKNAK